jgi:hypothetical protein
MALPLCSEHCGFTSIFNEPWSKCAVGAHMVPTEATHMLHSHVVLRSLQHKEWQTRR